VSLLFLDLEGQQSDLEVGNQEILLILIIDSILPKIKELIYQGWSLKITFFHLLPGLAKLGYLGHQFPEKMAFKKVAIS